MIYYSIISEQLSSSDYEKMYMKLSALLPDFSNARPHKALGMKTPMEIFSGRGGNPLMEYRYN